jgi:hypothetical protein
LEFLEALELSFAKVFRDYALLLEQIKLATETINQVEQSSPFI